MAQKEKDREKERDQFIKRSSSVGSNGLRATTPENHLSRSLSRDRNSQDPNKTYITISTGRPTRIRESSPTKKSRYAQFDPTDLHTSSFADYVAVICTVKFRYDLCLWRFYVSEICIQNE